MTNILSWRKLCCFSRLKVDGGVDSVHLLCRFGVEWHWSLWCHCVARDAGEESYSDWAPAGWKLHTNPSTRPDRSPQQAFKQVPIKSDPTWTTYDTRIKSTWCEREHIQQCLDAKYTTCSSRLRFRLLDNCYFRLGQNLCFQTIWRPFWGLTGQFGAGSCIAADKLLEENRAQKSTTDVSESVSVTEAADPSPIVSSDLKKTQPEKKTRNHFNFSEKTEVMTNTNSHPADVLLSVLLHCLWNISCWWICFFRSGALHPPSVSVTTCLSNCEEGPHTHVTRASTSGWCTKTPSYNVTEMFPETLVRRGHCEVRFPAPFAQASQKVEIHGSGDEVFPADMSLLESEDKSQCK